MRGGYLAASIMSLFIGLTFLPLAEATAIGFMAPLFITGLSMPLLGEKVSAHRWLAVVAGLVGVAIIVRPGSGLWQWTAVMPLIGAVCFALYQLTTRMLTATENTHTILFYTGLTGVIWSTITVVFFWHRSTRCVCTPVSRQLFSISTSIINRPIQLYEAALGDNPRISTVW